MEWKLKKSKEEPRAVTFLKKNIIDKPPSRFTKRKNLNKPNQK